MTDDLSSLDMVELLLAHGADAKRLNRDGASPLMLAAQAGNHGTIAWLLLQAGAEPNTGLPDGTTPLMAACVSGKRVIVRALLEFGADAAAVDASGRTAKDHCAEEGVAKLLA